jgi:hypothetical protein
MHQPRREIFDMFDNVLLLAKGGKVPEIHADCVCSALYGNNASIAHQVAYMGPRDGCLNFFAAHFASAPDQGQNPGALCASRLLPVSLPLAASADFLLDMVTDSRPEQLTRFASVWAAHAKSARPHVRATLCVACTCAHLCDVGLCQIDLRAKEALRTRRLKRPFLLYQVGRVRACVCIHSARAQRLYVCGLVMMTLVCPQIWLCLHRAMLQWIRNFNSELIYGILYFVMGLLVGLLFRDVEIEEVGMPCEADQFFYDMHTVSVVAE